MCHIGVVPPANPQHSGGLVPRGCWGGGCWRPKGARVRGCPRHHSLGILPCRTLLAASNHLLAHTLAVLQAVSQLCACGTHQLQAGLHLRAQVHGGAGDG